MKNVMNKTILVAVVLVTITSAVKADWLTDAWDSVTGKAKELTGQAGTYALKTQSTENLQKTRAVLSSGISSGKLTGYQLTAAQTSLNAVNAELAARGITH